MGCDIHPYFEIQDDQGKWHLHKWEDEFRGPPDPEDGYRPILEKRREEYWDHPFNLGRDYDLFAWLANVRNGFGFAGCDTGNPIDPLSAPRGIPDDASPEVKEASSRWSLDAHSHSWFTLKELQEADHGRKKINRGWIDFYQYPLFKEHGISALKSWSGGVSGKSIVHLTTAQADAMLQGSIKPKNDKRYVVQVSWELPIKDHCRHFFEYTIPAMAKLHEDPSKVRMVFFFDN